MPRRIYTWYTSIGQYISYCWSVGTLVWTKKVNPGLNNVYLCTLVKMFEMCAKSIAILQFADYVAEKRKKKDQT
ncbi:unnamed protein product [Musa acuminata subsp. malaccensis]|uniref:(wild Malaysian banana) hypothetical protein n=1 Tax=Musa acuminata subsp. malaccensis TaxID=214687 RepID=A0A804HXF3_MUSAM|nr:unnamed protein product [Musa acuminata subsp. malaccensis]